MDLVAAVPTRRDVRVKGSLTVDARAMMNRRWAAVPSSFHFLLFLLLDTVKLLKRPKSEDACCALRTLAI